MIHFYLLEIVWIWRITKKLIENTDHPVISKNMNFFLVFLFFLQSLKWLWDYKTAENFVLLSVSFKRPYERKEILSNDNYTLNYQKGTTKFTKLWRNEIKLNKHTQSHMPNNTTLYKSHTTILLYYFFIEITVDVRYCEPPV